MDAGVWSMTPSRNGVKSSRWMTLNEAIRCWERGFELEHGTPPNRKDVQNRPSIVQLYIERTKLEEAEVVAPSPGFKLFRAASALQSASAISSNGNTQPIEDKGSSQPANLFSEDSSFADYFGFLPQHIPAQNTLKASSTSANVPEDDGETQERSQPEPSEAAFDSFPTRRSLTALMQQSTSNSGLSRSHTEKSSSAHGHSSGRTPNPVFEIFNELSQTSLASLSELSDTNMDGVVFDEDLPLTPLEDFFERSNMARLRSDFDPSTHTNDSESTTASSHDVPVHSRTMDGFGDEDREIQLPGYWSSVPSLGDSLRASNTLDIVEDDRARFSFDDTLDGDMGPSEPAGSDSFGNAKTSNIKKRKRDITAAVDDFLDNDPENQTSQDKNLQNASRPRKKTKSGATAVLDELSSASAPTSATAKRQNFRKLNLKSGRKGRMDRDTMALALARKKAELARSLGPDLTPFDILDENTLEGIQDKKLPAPSSAAQGSKVAMNISTGINFASPALQALRSALSSPNVNKSAITKELLKPVLQESFGVSDFREGQFEAIQQVLCGESTLLVLPTGGGKSLCYQFPTICFEKGITLVVSPLLSLISDQLCRLPAAGLVGVSLGSNLSASETQTNLEKLRKGEANILFVSPEKLASQNFVQTLRQCALQINLVCVDEAHCMSTWSHNFRPSYLSIYRYAVEALCAKVVLALTATATLATAGSICQSLIVEEHSVIRFAPLGEHLSLNVKLVQERHDALEKILKSPELSGDASVIIYVMFQRQADDLAQYLQHRGLSTAAYHAGKTNAERTRVQSLFLSKKVKIMVATVAFGMGIDHRDVRGVIHFSIPKSVENYVQEVGRAGRDGKPAHCYLLCHPSDLHTLRSLAHSDTQDRAAIKSLLISLWPSNRRIQEAKTASSGQPRQLLLRITHSERHFDMKQSLLSTIFTWLANDNKIILKPQTHAICEMTFFDKPLETLKSRSKLLSQCASVGTKSKSTLSIPLDELANTRGTSVETVVAQLHELAESLQLSLAFKDTAFNLEIIDELHEDHAVDALIDDIVQRIKQLENVAIDKLDALYRIATQNLDQSMHQKIKAYFEAPVIASPKPIVPVLGRAAKETLSADIQAFLSSCGDDISTARQIARIFHGIASPNFPKEEWQLNRYWGSAVSTPFENILQVAQEQLLAAISL